MGDSPALVGMSLAFHTAKPNASMLSMRSSNRKRRIDAICIVLYLNFQRETMMQ